MSTHRRREGYWRVYHLAHTRERDELVRDIVALVRENEPPRRQRRTRRGRKKVHSWQKLICICLLMVILGYTFREMQNEVPSLNLPWNEPYPDHSTIHRAYQETPKEYLDKMLERVSSLCIKEAGWEKGVLAGDSSGVETDRYETVVRLNKRRRKIFQEVRRLFYLKYHIIAILDYLIILKVSVTSYRAADCATLRSMLKSISSLPGSVFDADRGFDAEYIFKKVYSLKMLPNIKQRISQKGPRGRGHKKEIALQKQSIKDVQL